MAQLRRDYSKFVEQNAEIIVIGPEEPQAFVEYWRKENLPFVGLPDPSASVLKRYGQEVNLFKLGRLPAQVIIDRAGVVRYVHYGKSMGDIPSNEEILGLLAELDAPSQSTPTRRAHGSGQAGEPQNQTNVGGMLAERTLGCVAC